MKVLFFETKMSWKQIEKKTMRYISDQAISNVQNRDDGDQLTIGGSVVKPSDLLSSVKRSLGRKPRCQCKHHQQRFLKKQEEQRQQLKKQLAEQGDRRHLTALNKHMRWSTWLLVIALLNYWINCEYNQLCLHFRM